MSQDFPELTSFGTLFIFANGLEAAAVEAASRAIDLDPTGAAQAALARCIKKHGKRGVELQRLRRERLNEVVLQPLSGMDRAAFLPPAGLPADAAEARAALVAVEVTLARFYEAAASLGGDVLMGVDKKFRKLARESRELADGVRG